MKVYQVEQLVWETQEQKKGNKVVILVLANSILEASEIAEEDEQHELLSVLCYGAISELPKNKYEVVTKLEAKTWKQSQKLEEKNANIN